MLLSTLKCTLQPHRTEWPGPEHQRSRGRETLLCYNHRSAHNSIKEKHTESYQSNFKAQSVISCRGLWSCHMMSSILKTDRTLARCVLVQDWYSAPDLASLFLSSEHPWKHPWDPENSYQSALHAAQPRPLPSVSNGPIQLHFAKRRPTL